MCEATRRLALRGPLVMIKAVHSGVFLVMLASILWLVWTGLTGRRDRSVGLAAGLVAIEAGVFVTNRGVCPLTPLAEQLGAPRGKGGVSDIFLPAGLARTIPIWSTTLLALAAVLHLGRVVCRPALLDAASATQPAASRLHA